MHAPGKFHRSRLALATWGHFLNDCYGSFFAPILPLLIDKLSLSLTMANGLAAVASITSAVFQPIYGMASDRIHGRLFIVVGPLLSPVCMSLIGVAPHPARLVILLLLAGVGSAAFHPQAMAVLFSIAVIREFTRIAVVSFLPIFLAMQGRSLAAGRGISPTHHW